MLKTSKIACLLLLTAFACLAEPPAPLSAAIAVIGGGSAGFAAAWSAAHLGSSVILIEKESMLGGTSTIGGVNNWEPGMGGTGVPYRVYQRLRQIPGAAGVYRFDRHLSWRKPWEKYTFPGGMIE
ncbi:MAG: FAD-dependent oxidoreductase, partial [Lentisphaerae bacterium]|nr:FAD-dependent oxidoreductase [Lentisphaerota bacterium]